MIYHDIPSAWYLVYPVRSSLSKFCSLENNKSVFLCFPRNGHSRVLVNINIYSQMFTGGGWWYISICPNIHTSFHPNDDDWPAITQCSRCPGNIFSSINWTIFYFRRNNRSGSVRRVRLPGCHHHNHRHSYKKVSWDAANNSLSLSLSLSSCNITHFNQTCK